MAQAIIQGGILAIAKQHTDRVTRFKMADQKRNKRNAEQDENQPDKTPGEKLKHKGHIAFSRYGVGY